MYQSEAVSKYLEELNAKKEEPKGKDEELISLLKNIGDFVFSEKTHTNSIISGIFMSFLSLVILGTMFSILAVFFHMSATFFGQPPPVDRGLLFFKNNCILMIGLFVVMWTFSDWLLRRGTMRNVKKALSLMMDKPYEVRIEPVNAYNYYNKKVKIIIEENQIYSGGVIKDKSKHITAYTDLRNSDKDLINFLFELAKKAEDSFSSPKKS
jgi:hypothetical protein